MPEIRLTPEDVRCAKLMKQLRKLREEVIPELEKIFDQIRQLNEVLEEDKEEYKRIKARLSLLKEIPEDYSRIQTAIAETQGVIQAIEAEIRSLGKNADLLEAYDMEADRPD